MLTLGQIIKSIDHERIQRSIAVKVTSLKLGWSKKTGLRMAICKTKTPENVGGKTSLKEYLTTITWVDEKKEYVKVQCSCSDFWARWEYVLHKKGAADIKMSDGTAPNKTNPSQILGACKHVAAMTAFLQDKRKLNNQCKLITKG